MNEAEIILKMAQAMHTGFWSSKRPAEKRLLTMASKAWKAIKGIKEVQEVLKL